MANWLERAQREIQNSLDQGAAKTAKTWVSAATAASHPEESGISRVSNGSNGSTSPTGSREIKGGILARTDSPSLPVMAEASRQKALAHPDDVALWWRVSILDPGGRTVEVDTPSGWTLADWQAYAERYHGPGCTVTPIAGLPKARPPAKLNEALAGACEGVAGLTKAQFRSRLSPEDVADIEAGGIHPKTLHGYAQSLAEGVRSGQIAVPGDEP